MNFEQKNTLKLFKDCYITESSCKDTVCSPCNLSCLAEALVKSALCTAVNLIESDPAEVFFYKRPKICEPSVYVPPELSQANLRTTPSNLVDPATTTDTDSIKPEEEKKEYNCFDDTDSADLTPPGDDLYADDSFVQQDSSSTSRASSEKCMEEYIDWLSAEDYSPPMIINQIGDFISKWELSPATKFVIVPRIELSISKNKGVRNFFDVHFSKPTPRCPNPLAVAVVHFTVHIPEMLPRQYPVMVTYKFQGYRTLFYASGRRCLHSLSFQRYFIDSILHMKLAFFFFFFECRHPPELDSKNEHEESSNVEATYSSK